VLTKLVGYPGDRMLADRASPAGGAGPPDGIGPGPGGWELTDAGIIALSRHEPGPFSVLFERHANEILHYAHARPGPDLAEDVLAETFLAAFRRREHYNGSYPDARPWLYGIYPDARPWLYGIAIREISKHRRAEQRGGAVDAGTVFAPAPGAWLRKRAGGAATEGTRRRQDLGYPDRAGLAGARTIPGAGFPARECLAAR